MLIQLPAMAPHPLHIHSGSSIKWGWRLLCKALSIMQILLQDPNPQEH